MHSCSKLLPSLTQCQNILVWVQRSKGQGSAQLEEGVQYLAEFAELPRYVQARAVQILRMHVMGNVRQRIEAGHRDFVNEIRVCTCLFLGFPSLKVCLPLSLCIVTVAALCSALRLPVAWPSCKEWLLMLPCPLLLVVTAAIILFLTFMKGWITDKLQCSAFIQHCKSLCTCERS